MNYRLLGKTGLRVSVLGLGTGTRFGDPGRNSPAAAARIVRAALDLGVNYFDTAAAYGEAEAMLGAALAEIPAEQAIVATKVFPADLAGRPIDPAELRASVERSLVRLRRGTLDILQLHGVRPQWLAAVLERLGPELERLHAAGKYRHLGVAETILEDPTHAMVPAAALDGRIAQALVAYNLLSPWAELTALPACQERAIGVVGMVAVRRALRDPELLGRWLAEARSVPEAAAELPEHDPLGWLLDEHTPDLAAAGYRFAIAHPAVSSVLAGTLNSTHLRANAAAVCAPAMSTATRDRVRRIFLRTDPRRWVPYEL